MRGELRPFRFEPEPQHPPLQFGLQLDQRLERIDRETIARGLLPTNAEEVPKHNRRCQYDNHSELRPPACACPSCEAPAASSSQAVSWRGRSAEGGMQASRAGESTASASFRFVSDVMGMPREHGTQEDGCAAQQGSVKTVHELSLRARRTW